MQFVKNAPTLGYPFWWTLEGSGDSFSVSSIEILFWTWSARGVAISGIPTTCFRSKMFKNPRDVEAGSVPRVQSLGGGESKRPGGSVSIVKQHWYPVKRDGDRYRFSPSTGIRPKQMFPTKKYHFTARNESKTYLCSKTTPGAGRNALGIAIGFYPALVSSPNKYFRPKSTILRYQTSPRHIFFRKQRGGRIETATPLQNAKGQTMEGFYAARCRVWGYKGSSGQR